MNLQFFKNTMTKITTKTPSSKPLIIIIIIITIIIITS